MTDFYDTSVLVAAFWADHPSHGSCLRLLAGARPETSACCAHSLAEVYAVTTRMPVKPRVLPEQAMLFIGNIRERLSIVALNSEEYTHALQASAVRGIVGGAIYDAMLAQCALKAQAETIFTWNLRHYSQCGPEVVGRVRTP